MMQVLVNSIVYASEIAIIAVGIALSYSILRFANFAHIQYAVVGGYANYLGTALGLPIVLPSPSPRSRRRSGGRRRRACLQPASRHRARRQDDRLLGVALFIRAIIASIFAARDRYRDERRPSTGGRRSLHLARPRRGRGNGRVHGRAAALPLPHAPRFGSARARQQLRSCRDARHIRRRHDPADVVHFRRLCGDRRLADRARNACAAEHGPDHPASGLRRRDHRRPQQRLRRGARRAVLSLAQNFAIAVDFGSLLGRDPWFIPSQFRDYIAVLAMVVVLILRPASARPATA